MVSVSIISWSSNTHFYDLGKEQEHMNKTKKQIELENETITMFVYDYGRLKKEIGYLKGIIFGAVVILTFFILKYIMFET